MIKKSIEKSAVKEKEGRTDRINEKQITSGSLKPTL